MRITNEELKDMIPRNQFAWPVPDLAADLQEERADGKAKVARIVELGITNHILAQRAKNAEAKVRELEALSASQTQALEMMEAGRL